MGARRRDSGNDHVTVRLAARGSVRRVEIDTSYFIGNSAGSASLRGIDSTAADLEEEAAWVELVPKTRLQPRASAKSAGRCVGGISAGQQQCDRVFGVSGVMP